MEINKRLNEKNIAIYWAVAGDDRWKAQCVQGGPQMRYRFTRAITSHIKVHTFIYKFIFIIMLVDVQTI